MWDMYCNDSWDIDKYVYRIVPFLTNGWFFLMHTSDNTGCKANLLLPSMARFVEMCASGKARFEEKGGVACGLYNPNVSINRNAIDILCALRGQLKKGGVVPLHDANDEQEFCVDYFHDASWGDMETRKLIWPFVCQHEKAKYPDDYVEGGPMMVYTKHQGVHGLCVEASKTHSNPSQRFVRKIKNGKNAGYVRVQFGEYLVNDVPPPRRTSTRAHAIEENDVVDIEDVGGEVEEGEVEEGEVEGVKGKWLPFCEYAHRILYWSRYGPPSASDLQGYTCTNDYQGQVRHVADEVGEPIVMHLCENKSCLNISHLGVGSSRENKLGYAGMQPEGYLIPISRRDRRLRELTGEPFDKDWWLLRFSNILSKIAEEADAKATMAGQKAESAAQAAAQAAMHAVAALVEAQAMAAAADAEKAEAEANAKKAAGVEGVGRGYHAKRAKLTKSKGK